ncbi:MAG TPA: Gfo/Idh/MocA family oxidoreductase [Geminicoccus sp.]|uniref:Gfo/Idh/MocA family protein n=1 Tax=Geminicoccus sp. TaxID=2024832 RepID=UPI002E37EC27|nr:Gfo/Idh/MocA family oxidoreductase [Geminicoccus sp.]HEX2527860.1 Gfo/Idh/MocA family oxidoreductase [Geminicoccus sp.]
MAKKPLRIGMVGYGFMGRAHSNGWRQVERFFPELGRVPVLQMACARDEGKLKAFADAWGYTQTTTDWRQVVESPDVDVVDICVPNNLHAEIASAAAKAGKAITCEKPLAMTVAEGEQMVEAVEAAKVPAMVWYNYRRVPAVTLAKQLVDEGRMGKVFHYRANFLQDWTISPDVPQGGAGVWRLDVEAAGSGVTGDLLAHNIDTAMWLNGPIVKVVADTETFVKERLHVETKTKKPVGIDDACAFLARFANGSMGLFESTRYARGHKALKTFELNGEDASFSFDLHDLQYLNFFEYKSRQTGEKAEGHLTGWRKIHVTNGEHPYMSHWWVPGLIVGYEHSFVHACADFVAGFDNGSAVRPDFRDALQTQKVCEAVLRSAKSGQWEETGAQL